MKFACNHSYKFKSATRAYLIAMLFVFASTYIEFVNIIVLCCYSDSLDQISSFVSLVIVKEFDNFIYEAMRGESFKEMLEI